MKWNLVCLCLSAALLAITGAVNIKMMIDWLDAEEEEYEDEDEKSDLPKWKK